MAEPEIERLKAVQAVLVKKMSGVKGVSAVGLGRGVRPGSLALHVHVQDKKTAKAIPASFEGVEVVVDVVGPITAF